MNAIPFTSTTVLDILHNIIVYVSQLIKTSKFKKIISRGYCKLPKNLTYSLHLVSNIFFDSSALAKSFLFTLHVRLLFVLIYQLVCLYVSIRVYLHLYFLWCVSLGVCFRIKTFLERIK